MLNGYLVVLVKLDTNKSDSKTSFMNKLNYETLKIIKN